MIKYIAFYRTTLNNLERHTSDSIAGIVWANDIFEASDLASQEYKLVSPILVRFDDSCVEDLDREVAMKKLPIVSTFLKNYRI
jgi:hypothetical protein